MKFSYIGNQLDKDARLAGSFANGAFVTANSAASFANGAFDRANAAFAQANTSGGAATYISNGTSNVFISSANGNIVANVGGGTIATVSNTGIRISGSGGDITGANNITANTITLNTSATIAGVNVIPFIQSAFNKANTGGGAATYISNGTSNVYFSSANGNIIANVGGSTVATISDTGIEISGNDGDISGANNITANTISLNTSAIIAGVNVIPFIQSAFNQANTGSTDTWVRIQANNAYDKANSAGSFANGAFLRANASYESQNTTASFANGAFDRANSAASFANGAFLRANASYTAQNTTSSFANGAFDRANSAASFANGAFTKANNALPLSGGTLTGNLIINASATVNGALIITGAGSNAITFADGTMQYTANTDPWARAQANAAYAQANTGATDTWVRTQANNAYNAANSGASFANGAFLTANASYTAQNTTASFANGAFVTANSGASFANGAFDRANSAASFANGAFLRANASYASQNTTASFANGAFDRANAAFNQANTGGAAATYISNGTSNVFISSANGNIVVNVGGSTIATVSNTGIQISGSDGDISDANNIFANVISLNTSATIAGVNVIPFIQSAFNKANTGSGNASFIFSGTSNVYFSSANGSIVANVGGSTVATVSNTGIRISGSGGDITGANNIFANTISLNTSATIAGVNVIPFIQSAFNRANTPHDIANNAAIFANGAFAAANSVSTTASASFIQANSAFAHANAAFAAANTGGSSSDSWARTQANAAFDKANTVVSGITIDNFTGNGSNTVFTLSTTVSSANNTIVNIDGVNQLRSAYTVSSNQLTFSSAPATSASIEVTTISVGSASGGGGGSAAAAVGYSLVFGG